MRHSRLPPELIDAIMDNFHEDHDRDGLLACSLVCRSWVSPSQRHLFRRVTLALNGDDCQRLDRALLSSPHLAGHIRELKVHLRGVNGWTTRVLAHRVIDQSLAATVLFKLNKLQSIELRKLDWCLMTVDLRQSLQWVLLRPSIKFLTLDITQYEGDSEVSFVSFI
jgi:F-box-like